MDGKIYDLLKKIDDFTIAKFGLEKDQRIFLKKLLLDEKFLNLIIEKNGGNDNFSKSLEEVYSILNSVNNDVNKIKEISGNNEELRNITNQYFGKELEEIEEKKDDLLDEIILRSVEERNMKENDDDKIKEILNKLKN